ncbi:hypothetical protein [Actinomadura macra]|uniref:hypothetical protein n=1 Tax=Actinomadura macra TaxID=46164 RepID=UPI00082A109D|nr:hypothetical protein [Actinomadura macra]
MTYPGAPSHHHPSTPQPDTPQAGPIQDGAAAPSLTPCGAYHPIVFFDIAAFGNSSRDNDIQRFVRSGLYQILHCAFGHVGAPPTAYYRQDYGDGVLAIFPPTIPADTIAALPLWLHREIRRYNKCASPIAHIQLRAAFHVGPVYWDDHGAYGQAVIHAARLIDAQPVREALASTGADLAFVISGLVYNDVIQHHPQLADPPYRSLTARVKESTITAWLTLPDAPSPDHQHHLVAVTDLH